MRQIEITIQRKMGDGWAFVVDARTPDRLPQRSEGFLAFEAADWQEELRTGLLDVQVYGELLGRAVFREGRRDLFLRSRSAASDEPLQVLLVVEAPGGDQGVGAANIEGTDG